MPAAEDFADDLEHDSLSEPSYIKPGSLCVVAKPAWPDLDTDVGELVEVIEVASTGAVWTAPVRRRQDSGAAAGALGYLRSLIVARRLRLATTEAIEAAGRPRPAPAQRAARRVLRSSLFL